MFSHYFTLFLSLLFGDVASAPVEVAPVPAVEVAPVVKAVKRRKRPAPKVVSKPQIAAEVEQVASAPKVAPPVVVAAAGSADEAVGKVQAFYNSTKSFTANFTQTVTNQTFNKLKPKVSRGRVYILKPGKMRFDYKNLTYKSVGDPKVDKSFISDGKHLWAVMNKSKQYYKSDLANSALPTAVSFLMGTGDLRKDFHVVFEKAGKFGGPDDLVLLLTPKSPSARYKKLWLVIDKSNYSVKESIVLNSKNDTNSIRFGAVKINSGKLRPGHFLFNAKANKDYRLVTPPK